MITAVFVVLCCLRIEDKIMECRFILKQSLFCTFVKCNRPTTDVADDPTTAHAS